MDETHYFAMWVKMDLKMKVVVSMFIVFSLAGLILYLTGKENDFSLLFSALFFGFCAIILLVLHFYFKRYPKVTLVVNSKGLWFPCLVDVLPWDQIDRLKIHHMKFYRFGMQTSHMININVDVADRTLTQFTKKRSGPIARMLQRLTGINELAFHICTLNESPEAVVAIIRKFHPVEGHL